MCVRFFSFTRFVVSTCELPDYNPENLKPAFLPVRGTQTNRADDRTHLRLPARVRKQTGADVKL